jgi:cupin
LENIVTNLPLPTGKIFVIPMDARRGITESTFNLPDGGVCRLGTITVRSDIEDSARLGDHYHPGTESFEVSIGGGWLYTANAQTPERISTQRVVAGDTIVIPANVVHTFLLEPGSVLRSVANAPFDNDWIVGCMLNLPVDA